MDQRATSEIIEKITKYLAKAVFLNDDTSPMKDFEETTAMAWEMMVTLPKHIYDKILPALKDNTRIPEVLHEIRRTCLDEENYDTMSLDYIRDNIILHKRGIGRKK